MAVNQKNSRSLAGIAGIVAVATLISKIFGLVREQVIAAAFGVGSVVNAYSYAYTIPSFLFILLGGINGPFHSALVSVLAKRDQKEAAPLVETITTLVGGILLLVTVVLMVGADFFIEISAPGLDNSIKAIAVHQLQIMAPLALLGGLIGIGFGTLNASDQYWLPSISPLFSSVVVILGGGALLWELGSQANAPQYVQLGSLILAGGTLLGAVLQWVVQVWAQWKSGLGKLRLRFDWRQPGVMDVIKVMGPATLSSGMLYINTYTDLFFASYISDSAASIMRYANFIILTPLGIISNMILVPLLPEFSRLYGAENLSGFKGRIRQGLLLTALSMLPLTAIFISLAFPIIRVIYQRGAFSANASAEVAPVLITYGLGMFFYLGRDLLVRVFYSMELADIPFRISIINILLNGVFDFLLYKPLGTPGLVLATISVNIFSLIMFLVILQNRLGGLPLLEWGTAIFKLILITGVTSLGTWGVNRAWEQFLGHGNLFLHLLQLGVTMGIAFVIFFLLAMPLKLPEVEILLSRVLKKISRKTRQ